MADSTSPMNKFFVETIIKGLEESKRGIDNIQKSIHANDLKIVEIDGKLKKVGEMEDSVKEIKKIVKDGNGTKSVLARLDSIETQIGDINKYIEANKTAKSEDIKSRQQFRISLLTSGIALFGVILSQVLQFFR